MLYKKPLAIKYKTIVNNKTKKSKKQRMKKKQLEQINWSKIKLSD